MGDEHEQDMAARPMPFIWAWGVPILLLVSTNFINDIIPITVIILLIVFSFIWMGVACLLNAKRCRRRHCYYSGPIFLLGALVSLFVGFKVIDFGQDGLSMVIGVTLFGALATYGSELIWGKYWK